MVGPNEILLNEATLIQALQEWLSKRMILDCPTVTGVKADSRDGFKVTLEAPKRA